jgi:hypothetical protein
VPQHMSNSERIARAAAEASAKAAEKAEKAAKKAAAPKKPRAAREPKTPARMKIVWAVGDPGAAPAATFPYSERAAADADCARRGKNCIVKPLKVPME